MATMVNQIKEYLKTKVSSVTNVNYTYTFEKAEVEGYPYAVILRKNSEVEIADFCGTSKRNKRTYRFNIDIFTEQNEASFGPEKAETINDGIIDEVMTAFDMDTTLSGILLYSKLELQEEPRFGRSGNIVNIASFNFEGWQLVESN